MYMTHTHWVSCQRGSLAITAFQFLDTLHRCYTFNYLFSHVLAAWQQKHTETTSFTSAMVFENLLQLDPNRAPPQLTKKNCILHPLWRSQACERLKMADIPTQLANSCWLKYWSRRPGELIFRTFCSCSTIKAHFCHLKKLLEIYKKHIRRINGFMLQMHQTYHDAVFFGHTH